MMYYPEYSETAYIDKQKAVELLRKNPEKQRKLDESYSMQLAREMSAGRWNDAVFDLDPIVLSEKGELYNGQHRCRAVVLSGHPIKAVIKYGVSEEIFGFIDNGKPRNVTQFLDVPYGKNVATLAKYAIGIESGVNLATAMQGRVQNTHVAGKKISYQAARQEILRYIDNNAEVLIKFSKEARSIYGSLGNIGNKTAISEALWTIWYLYDGSSEEIDDFISDFKKDIPSHPALLYGRQAAVKTSYEAAKNHMRVSNKYWMSLIFALFRARKTKKVRVSQKDLDAAFVAFDKALRDPAYIKLI